MNYPCTIVILVLVTIRLTHQDAVPLDKNQQASVAPEVVALDQQLSNASTISSATARLLAGVKPSAPYALDDSTSEPTTSAGVENLIFRLLSLNRTSEPDDEQTGQQASLQLRGLLEALNSNGNFGNLSSEVRFDGHSPGMVNITISNLRNLTQDGGQANRQFFEELLADSKYSPTFNVSAVMKDNHRLLGRYPTRSKLPTTSMISESSITGVPAIRRTADVVAENYTTKKIADEANIFSLKLINQFNLESLGNENIIQSPFSIYQGLALLLSGAMGDTSRELDRVLLSVQSVYENTKLTHDQDRARLMASFGDVVRQLQQQSTNHWRPQPAINCTFSEDPSSSSSAELECASPHSNQPSRPLSALDRMDSIQYRGGTDGQHFIVANNLLFSPGAYEISNEFKHTLSNYFNNTALTKMEIGSTESIQVVNSWIRQATAGLIPAIMSKRSTFDEFNVMTLLSTSWLSQEWAGSFRRVASSLRSSIRLKGQTSMRGAKVGGHGPRDEPLLEFIDDQKSSHFVDYIRSEPTRQIHNYHTVLNKHWVNVVVVPFRESNQRLITITPMQAPPPSLSATSSGPATITLNYPSPLSNLTETLNSEVIHQGDQQVTSARTETSPLSKLLNSISIDPRRAMRSLWNTIAPDLITKQTILSMQMARQNNRTTIDEKLALRSFVIPPKTQLSIPMFKIEADSSISASLNHVGVVNSFDPAQANFIGINGHPFNYNKLHLSNVIYKTTFNLNEEGVNYDRTIKTLEPLRVMPQKKQKLTPQEMPLEPSELVNEVKLNKPFLFLVADTKSKLVLYTGIVRNPAKESSRVR